MALGIQTTGGDGGDFADRIEYDAKAARWHVVERVQGANGWSSTKTWLKPPFAMVMEPDSIEVGWLDFGAKPPVIATVKLGQVLPAKPTPEAKQGVRVMLFFREHGVRQWSTSAKCVLAAFDKLHDDVVAAQPANAGKSPVIHVEDSIPVTTGQGAKSSTNYAPVFSIKSWVDTPADMKGQPKIDPPKERAPDPVEDTDLPF